MEEDEDRGRFVALPSYTAHPAGFLCYSKAATPPPLLHRHPLCIFLQNYAKDLAKIYQGDASSVLDPAYDILLSSPLPRQL